MVSLYAWRKRQARPPRPMLPFEDWIRLPPADPMLLFLQTCVPRTHIYRLDQIRDVLAELGEALKVPVSRYKPVGVTGSGAGATEEQRALVRLHHPLDCEFWAGLPS